ncbi:MAG: hypothetical protein VX278_06790, partial [Myxococcota bacterium]|nr:hypothetical protein [Myxococcota bacterium]
SVTLSPDPLYTDDLLTAAATTSDLDGDSLTLTYEWAINGTTVQSGSDPTFHKSLFRKEDLVTVTVTADDGVDASVAVSTSLTCQNSLPQAPVISITPSEPVEGEDDLVCTVDVESSDADGDSIVYDFAWTVNGVPFTGATDTSLSSTVSVADTEEGEEWICVVTPDDGDDGGASATSSATIESPFETSTFTNCGATGMYGPSQSDCDSEYASSALSGLITVSSGVQYWTVPASGTYTIAAYGAQGGSIGGYTGGLGAMIVGDFSLTAGDVIEIVVGQVGLGAGQGSGGGGGTYVVHNGGSSVDDILVIAGGGGGANSYSGFNGLGGTTGTGGLSSNIPGHGGSGGNGGGGGCAGGGGGFFGDGDLGAHSADGGQSFLNGSVGGEARQSTGYDDDGGFGGGGAGSWSNGYGGGGGGYSGGGGGNWNGTAGYGGGAGSYNNGSNQSNSADNNSGHGSVVISKN